MGESAWKNQAGRDCPLRDEGDVALEKLFCIAAGAAAETVELAVLMLNVERRRVLLVKRTQALVATTCWC